MAARDDVRLNEMNSLFDLGRFPLPVCAGAVLNVLLTIAVTRWVRQGGLPINLAAWIVLVLAVNLLPVILLRLLTLKPGAVFRRVREMSFAGDQHKFPLWVYLLASANMTGWIAASWMVFGRPDNPAIHSILIVAALVTTAFPAWIRLLLSR